MTDIIIGLNPQSICHCSKFSFGSTKPYGPIYPACTLRLDWSTSMKPDTDHFCPHPHQERDSAGVAPLQHKHTLLRPLQGKLLITRPETPSPAIQNPISTKLLSKDVSSRFFYRIMPFTPLQKPPSLHRLPCGSNNRESACNAGDPVSVPGVGRSLGEGNLHL